jgi:hypothetical protein
MTFRASLAATARQSGSETTAFRHLVDPPSSIIQSRDLQLVRLRGPPARVQWPRSVSGARLSVTEEISDGLSAVPPRQNVSESKGPFDTTELTKKTPSILRDAAFKTWADPEVRQIVAQTIFERDLERLQKSC